MARDPQARREAIARAAAQLVAEVGLERVTHRAVARRAGVPLGATTYYFDSLPELVTAGLELVAGDQRTELAHWRATLTRDNLPSALPRLAAAYLSDRPRAVVEYELYVAASRDEQLRPLARVWLDGLREVLNPLVGSRSATTLVAVLDGFLLTALVVDCPLDRRGLADTIRAVLGAG